MFLSKYFRNSDNSRIVPLKRNSMLYHWSGIVLHRSEVLIPTENSLKLSQRLRGLTAGNSITTLEIFSSSSCNGWYIVRSCYFAADSELVIWVNEINEWLMDFITESLFRSRSHSRSPCVNQLNWRRTRNHIGRQSQPENKQNKNRTTFFQVKSMGSKHFYYTLRYVISLLVDTHVNHSNKTLALASDTVND